MEPIAYVLLIVTSFHPGAQDRLVVYRMSLDNGALTRLNGTIIGVERPLFVDCDPTGRFVYVADPVKTHDGEPGGAISSYTLNHDTGELTFLNRQHAGGVTPCHVRVTRDGGHVLIANYSDGSISMLPTAEDGSLKPTSVRIQHGNPAAAPGTKVKTNAHSLILDPAERFALAADLGLDQILVYRFDRATSQLTPHEPAFFATAPKSGPRHLAFHPNGRTLYAMTEYDNTVIAMTYDGDAGVLSALQIEPTLPADFTGKSYGADIHVHPTGRFLYVTNRGHDSITIFAVDADSGRLTLVGHEPVGGEFPRGFAIDPTGRFLLVGNEKSDRIVTFRIDVETGRLSATGAVTTLPKPTCLQFLPVR